MEGGHKGITPGQLVYLQRSGVEGDARSCFDTALIVATDPPWTTQGHERLGCDLRVTVWVSATQELKRCCDCSLLVHPDFTDD